MDPVTVGLTGIKAAYKAWKIASDIYNVDDETGPFKALRDRVARDHTHALSCWHALSDTMLNIQEPQQWIVDTCDDAKKAINEFDGRLRGIESREKEGKADIRDKTTFWMFELESMRGLAKNLSSAHAPLLHAIGFMHQLGLQNGAFITKRGSSVQRASSQPFALNDTPSVVQSEEDLIDLNEMGEATLL